MNDNPQYIEAACCELRVNDEPARAFEKLHGIEWTNTEFGVRACWTDAWRLAQATQREACSAAKGDERNAWHPWPDQKPTAAGDYLVLLQAPDTLLYIDIGVWESGIDGSAWLLNSDPNDLLDAWPIAWRPLPPLPEWAQ